MRNSRSEINAGITQSNAKLTMPPITVETKRDTSVAVGARGREVFLKRLFSSGAVYEELFNNICKAGCDAETLGDLLFSVSGISVANQKGFLDLGDISAAQLKRLTKDLRSLADLVERVNGTRFNPTIEIRAAPPNPSREPIRKHVARLYDRLPSTMRMYSFHLERFSKISKALFKRLKLVHIMTIDLLLYVEASTGSPRYEDLSNLLTGGFLADGGEEAALPKFFSADALAKLKQRTEKFRRTSRS